MSELPDVYALLTNLLLDDPLLCLANAVVWLDPLWASADGFEYEEGDSIGNALHITRGAFPDIYAGAIELLRAGANERELDRYICGEITKRGIPLDDIDALGYGIPLYAHGIELSNPEVYAMRPDLLPVVDAFGIHPQTDIYSVDIPDIAYTAARLAADSLVKQDDPQWKQLGWSLAWLFSCSGNTLIDFDDEALAEIQPLMWEADDIALAVELIEEANGIMLDAEGGLKLLDTHPIAAQTLTENVKFIYRKLAQMKGKKHEPHIRLEWTPFDLGTDREAVNDPELLQLWVDAA